MHTDLSYTFPGAGRLDVTLYEFASTIYEELTISGDISRMMSTPQLGHLRALIPGAHHTRYEYIFLQWRLLQQLREVSKGELALSRRFRDLNTIAGEVTGSNGPSGLDLLQSLALITNCGHNHLSFAQSRGLCLGIDADSSFRRCVRDLFPVRVRSHIDSLIDLGNWGKLHTLLPFVLMTSGKTAKSVPSTLSFMEILWEYLFPTLCKSVPRQRIYRAYDELRTLAYCALDSHFAPVPFTISLMPLINQLDLLADDITDQRRDDLAAVDSLSNGLRRSVYQTEPATLVTASIAEQVAKDFDATMKGKATEHRVRSYLKRCYKSDYLQQNLVKASFGVAEKRLLRIDFPSGPGSAKVPIHKDFQLEKQYRATLNVQNTEVSYEWDANRRNLVFVAAIDKEKSLKIRFENASRVCTHALNLIGARPGKYWDSHANVRYRQYRSILRFAIDAVLPPSMHCSLAFEFVAQRKRCYYEKNIGDGFGHLKQTMSNLASRGESPESIHEVATLLNAYKKYKSNGRTLLYSGSLTIIREGQTGSAVEIDGVLLCFSKRGNLKRIVISEAKKTGSGATTLARKALRNKLTKIASIEEQRRWSIDAIDGGAVAVLEY